MQRYFRDVVLLGVLTFGAAVVPALRAAAADASGYTLNTLYTFCVQSGCPDGDQPAAGVVKDKSGTLYSAAFVGGQFDEGDVFSLGPKGGQYKFKVLHSFCKQTGCTDGSAPQYGMLIQDVKGNLYGTTFDGGAAGSGLIFRLSLAGTKWKYKVLYSFCARTNCADGGENEGGLSYQGQASGAAWDGKSPLFGGTDAGGANGNGTIFEFTPNGSQWDYSVIHNIQTGQFPNAVLVDQGGNLFITSEGGGANDGGNFYTLANGTWKEGTIHNFCALAMCADGAGPHGTLALDASGNVYGVTTLGGSGNNGVVFEHPASGGFAVIYNFCADGSCGVEPFNLSWGNVSHDLFGVALSGGAGNKGLVYALAFKNGTWNQTVIHDFCADGNCTSGAEPQAPILEDSSGNLFSTTDVGGNLACGGGNGCGTVFELKK